MILKREVEPPFERMTVEDFDRLNEDRARTRRAARRDRGFLLVLAAVTANGLLMHWLGILGC